MFGGAHDEIGILNECENCNPIDNECWADVGLTEKDVYWIDKAKYKNRGLPLLEFLLYNSTK